MSKFFTTAFGRVAARRGTGGAEGRGRADVDEAVCWLTQFDEFAKGQPTAKVVRPAPAAVSRRCAGAGSRV